MKKFNFFISLTFLFASLTISAQTVTQWRGDRRDGIYNEKQLLKSWPEKGPAMLWFNETIGEGYSSPAVLDNKLLINGEIDSISHVFAFDLNGQLLWKTPNGKEFMGEGFSAKFPGSRSTPTVVGDLVYSCSGQGRITCLELQTGKEKWAINVVDKFKGIINYFGYSESLLIDGDNLFFTPGGIENNVVALNRFTGQTVWTSKALSDTVSYCSPMIIKLPSRSVLVNFSSFYIMGLDASTGELLWSQKQEKVTNKQQCNTPIFENGYIYFIAGEGNGAAKLQLSPDGKSIKEIWSNKSVKNGFYGFVKLGDNIYSGDRAQKLKCINAQTGLVTDSIKMIKCSVIAADDMLYCYSDNGEISLVKPSNNKLELVSKFKCEKGTREHCSHPVIKNGVLYIRHTKVLMAYDIKQK